jgi:hypothetical protein
LAFRAIPARSDEEWDHPVAPVGAGLRLIAMW